MSVHSANQRCIGHSSSTASISVGRVSCLVNAASLALVTHRVLKKESIKRRRFAKDVCLSKTLSGTLGDCHTGAFTSAEQPGEITGAEEQNGDRLGFYKLRNPQFFRNCEHHK